MSFDDTIKAYFVTNSNGSALSEDISAAYAYLKDHIKEEHISHIKPNDGYALIASGRLTKKDVFVFQKFEGDFFTQLQQTKSLIVGPRCLISCLLKCEPIPLGTSPVFTTAMRDLQISASGITPEEKEKLRVLISWMGGHYFQNFGRSITHLISNTIKSTKYEHATLNGIPVMHVDWVQRVWDRSCTENVNATDEEFEKYKLPIFFEVNITCTGLDNTKKNDIIRLVNENGGIYNRAFRSQYTDIVIVEKSKANTDKYQAAVRYKKDVLVPEWIFDSVQKGYALPTKPYQVSSVKSSTPTKIDQSAADFHAADCTQLSEVSRISMVDTNGHAGSAASRGNRGDLTVNDTIFSLNDTQMSAVAQVSKPMERKILTKTVTNYKLILDEICPRQAKKAGNFLDGCSIYMSGFRTDEKEKLNRILNVGGATRYDTVNDKITHIIVGQLDGSEIRAWKRDGLLSVINIVRLDWLLESIKLKQPASEVVYRVSLPTSNEPEAPSPSSKRTLRSMNHSFKQPNIPIKKKLFQNDTLSTSSAVSATLVPVEILSEQAAPDIPTPILPAEEEELDLIAQYSQENELLPMVPLPPIRPSLPMASSTQNKQTTEPPKPQPAAPRNESEMTNAGISTMDYENLDFFQGMSVYIDAKHFDEEFYSQMIGECEAAQGNVVQETFRDPVDYAIVSFEKILNKSHIPIKAKHIVTELYVEDCMKHNKLIPLEYYHKPIPHTAESCPLSGMTIVVSIYSGLERDFIDSIAQLLGANVNKTFVKKEKPLLVCSSAEGSKYEGALKWNYPVVTSAWLLACSVEGVKLPYRNYLVGECSEDFPLSPTLRERNTCESAQAGTKQAHNSMPMDVEINMDLRPSESSNSAVAKSSSTPTSDFTPLRNKRVSELAGPVLKGRNSISGSNNNNSSALDSPHTPTNTGRRAGNFDFMESILAEIEDEDERECLRECIIEMRNNQTPELERIRRQACTPINRKIPTPKGIPNFCTTPEFEKRISEEFERRWCLPTKKLKPDTPIDEIRKRVLRATCKMFGIEYNGDEETTPLQHCKAAGNGASTSNHIRPRSIYSSATPSSSQSPHLVTSSNSLQKSTINFDKISFEESSVAAAASPEMKQISDYLKNCESRRKSLRKASNNQPQETEMLETEGHMIQPFHSEQFGGGTDEMVGWRDPSEFTVSRRSKPSAMQYHGTPRFSISCSEDSTRADVIHKISRLRGTVSDNLISFDPNCTHFLCERPNRGEKMLGCISSGKWILSLGYIEECYAKNVFVDEELFEWGNPKAYNLPVLPQDEQTIAKAAHRWRKQIAESTEMNSGAFEGFRAILRISDRHLESLKNVIKAGNGEIIQAQSPYAECDDVIYRATHCFVDVKRVPLTPRDYTFLHDNGVRILSQMYINEYLMNGPDADISKFEIVM